ncbi:MAG TPA: HAD family phosphatase [Actinomycetota bacterium]|nr:HAD family phosphatase [Actinomycetota bacterium]
MAEPRDRTFRALVVDYGGVLTTSLIASFGQFCASVGIQPDTLRTLFGGAYGAEGGPAGFAELIPQLETGKLALDEFDRRLAAALSEGLAEPLEPAGLSYRFFEGVQPEAAMLDAVRRAGRAGLKTGLITNTWGEVAAAHDLTGLFDVEVRSGEEGLRKPDPEIYRLAADRLGVPPEECVFVDDIPANVEGARAVGMWAILHRDPAITIPKLEDVLGTELS